MRTAALRLVRRGDATPKPGDEAVLRVAAAHWVPWERVSDELTVRKLSELIRGCPFYFEDSTVHWEVACRHDAERRLADAVRRGVLEEWSTTSASRDVSLSRLVWTSLASTGVRLATSVRSAVTVSGKGSRWARSRPGT